MTFLTGNKFVDAFEIGVLATVVSYAVAFIAGWIVLSSFSMMFLLEVFAVFTSFACTYLCVVQSRWNYPVGVVTTVAYTFLFWNAGLFASAALNAYLAPALLYGWFRWRVDTNTLPVTRLNFDKWLAGYGILTILAYAFVTGVGVYFDATFPALDTGILVLSILAQLLLDNKKIETWAVWAVVNILSIYVYFNAGLYLVALQYVFFLGNTAYGAWEWYRTMEKNGAPSNEAILHN